VEDLSNLLANAMFDKNLAETEVLADIKMLCRRVGCVIAVTISDLKMATTVKKLCGISRPLNHSIKSFLSLPTQ
jgi:hypothetical protein